MSPWSVTAFGSRGRRIACLDPGALKPVSERRTLHRCLPKLGSSMNFIWNAGLVCIRQQQINNPERISQSGSISSPGWKLARPGR